MFEVYETVDTIYKQNYDDSASEEFKKGFEKCLHYFGIGILKHPQFNLRLKVREQEVEIAELKKVRFQNQQQIVKLKAKLNDSALASGTPLDTFREVEVETKVGVFSVVINMDKSTLLACLTNFKARYDFTRVDECKSKLLQYINNKSSYGFRAYKDMKTFRKDHQSKR